MFVVKGVCLLIFLFGLSILWGVVGIVIVALNENELDFKNCVIRRIVKTILCGPLYLIFCYVRYRNKKQ